MPSTLYESVKKSVIEFTQIKKKNEKQEDKLIFRWKLITLGLSIFLIVLIGVFSQLLKIINQLPDVTVDQTFVLPLIQKINENSISKIENINNLIKGITSGLSENGVSYQWNRADLLYRYDTSISMETINSQISGRSNLVFIFNSLSSFGLFSLKSFGNVFADDQSHSTIFSLDSPTVLKYTSSSCSLFNKTPTNLVLFNMIDIKLDGSINIGLIDGNPACFGSDETSAYAKITELTGIIFPNQTPQIYVAKYLQIYSLSLDQSL